MKILLDTNVILDFFLARPSGEDAARQLFEWIYQEKIDAFITASSITDIYYIVAKRLGGVVARRSIKQLLQLLRVIAVDGHDCVNALTVPISDFEDALITVCARKESMDYIITNDTDFLQTNEQIAAVVSPKQFFTLFA